MNDDTTNGGLFDEDPDFLSFDDQNDQPNETRICVNCAMEYEIDLERPGVLLYIDPPWDWGSGCYTHCLACWLCDDWFKPSPDSDPKPIGDDDIPF